MEGLVKIGPWGGPGGHPFVLAAASSSSSSSGDVVVAPHRLESVVIRCAWAIDAISFTYAGIDGTSRKSGPWGGSGGQKQKVKFGETEVVTEVSGTYGPFDGQACVLRSLTFVTNVGKHGPFGRPGEGTPFSVPVQDGGRVVGFFGRSGYLLDALGVYVHP
ncbi:hypothetical protein U9M48_041892 [Paspalum notatum var. saurae]|uniref:Jacalin-type lectin domain-containing protein n=1 Tax=Paspalum notatum var. saurae TaxID=547442 RepID=A0AAQ3UQ95_PASNO